MRRLIGRVDRQQHHAQHADAHGHIGRLGHVAAGRGGHELGQSGNHRLGHAGWQLGPGSCGPGWDFGAKVPARTEAVNDGAGDRRCS